VLILEKTMFYRANSLRSRVAPYGSLWCRSFYSEKESSSRILHRKSSWLLVAVLAGGGYSYYTLRNKLHTTQPLLGLCAQQKQDEFRVAGKGSEDMNLKRDSELWMSQQEQISPKRRAAVFSLGIGGVVQQQCDSEVTYTSYRLLVSTVVDSIPTVPQ